MAGSPYPPETRQRAVALRESGATWSAIVSELGVPQTTVIRWCRPDYAASSRATARRYKAANREAMRAYDREYRLARLGTCHRCDGPMGVTRDGVCTSCRDASVSARREHMSRLWKEGWTMNAIAEYFGWSLDQLGVEMVVARRAGVDLPYRYAVQNRRRVAA